MARGVSGLARNRFLASVSLYVTIRSCRIEFRAGVAWPCEALAMEDWLAAGSLSAEELELLVKLTARYFWHDVDQFEHWLVPGPDDNTFYVDFRWQPVDADPGGYVPMWPPLPADQPGWVITGHDPDGTSTEVIRFATEHAAREHVRVFDANASQARSGRTYTITPPQE